MCVLKFLIINYTSVQFLSCAFLSTITDAASTKENFSCHCKEKLLAVPMHESHDLLQTHRLGGPSWNLCIPRHSTADNATGILKERWYFQGVHLAIDRFNDRQTRFAAIAAHLCITHRKIKSFERNVCLCVFYVYYNYIKGNNIILKIYKIKSKLSKFYC